MQSPVDLIKSKLSVVDVVSSYLKLEKSGINFRARCPFHNERTPSFFVSPGRETFHCFGCGKGGDIFTFVEEIEGLEFRETLKMLAERAGVALSPEHGRTRSVLGRLRTVLEISLNFYQTQLRKNNVVLEYIRERGISKESVEDFRLGFAPLGWRNLADFLRGKKFDLGDAEAAGLVVRSNKSGSGQEYYDRFRGRLMFPFFDYSGRPIGFSSRVVPGIEEAPGREIQGKYVNSPETPLFHKSRVFYGIDRAKQHIRESDRVILVEGQIDTIMAHQAGTRNVVGVSGTALSGEHVDILSRLTDNITVVLDSDEAGFKASERSVRLALSKGMYVSVVDLPAQEDPASYIKRDPPQWKAALVREKSFTDYALEFVTTRYPGSKEAREALHDFLYPHIKDMYNEIEKDKVLQRVSTVLGVSTEAANKDFQKWLTTQGGPLDKEVAGSVDKNTSTSLVTRRLWGIVGLLESRSKVKEAGELRDALMKLCPAGDLDASELLFEAEVYYPPVQDLSGEIELLLKRLNQDILRQEFAEAMVSLKLAEGRGDVQETEKWLLKCQELSKKMI